MRNTFLLALLFFPLCAGAYAPRLVGSDSVVIVHPEISQVFYDTLLGEARAYRMTSDVSWTLDLSILAPLPANSNGNGKFDAVVVNESNGTVASILEAGNAPWQAYDEPVGGDGYLRGPHLRQELPAGAYRIMVTSGGNVGRYALEIGGKNKFSFREQISTIALLPHLKKDFFGVSTLRLLASPLMVGYACALLLFGALLAMYARRRLPRLSFHKEESTEVREKRNIGTLGRIVRASIGLLLVIGAVLTTWNPILFVAAGFCFFEASASWCAVFRILGKNSCAIEA